MFRRISPWAHVQDAAFVRKIVKCAYEAGARYVSVEWHDSDLTRMAYEYESKEVLSQVPQWKYDKTKAQHDDSACYITVLSDKPGVMAGVDSEKIKAANMAYYTKRRRDLLRDKGFGRQRSRRRVGPA